MSSDAKVQRSACTCSGPNAFLVLCHIILFNLPSNPAGGSKKRTRGSCRVETGGSDGEFTGLRQDRTNSLPSSNIHQPVVMEFPVWEPYGDSQGGNKYEGLQEFLSALSSEPSCPFPSSTSFRKGWGINELYPSLRENRWPLLSPRESFVFAA